MELKIRRVTEMKTPFYIVAEGAIDWTHFSYIHRRSHKVFRLLYKNENKLVIFYKARVLYPFPFFKNYLIVREDLPAQFGYQQVYMDLSNQKIHFLRATVEKNKETASIVGDFVFDVGNFWKLFPSLFFFIFKLRMRTVMSEDNVYMAERQRLGTPTDESCEVKVPKQFCLLAEYLSKTPLPAHFDFQDHVLTDLSQLQ
jgi:hypothetical protein